MGLSLFFSINLKLKKLFASTMQQICAVKYPRAAYSGAPFILFFCFLIFSFSFNLHAKPVQNVTYDQFETLVKEKTAQIPYLQSLWSWRTEYKQPIYLGGGILRGLLRWLEENLRTRSFEQVRRMAVPDVERLLIQKDADRDLFYDFDTNWFTKNYKQYETWDVLPIGFWKDSVEAGGAAIEKIRVSPDQIEDPLDGLRAFYEGRLKYVDVSESIFSRFRAKGGQLSENTKIALVLRALRFVNDMPSLEIDNDTFSLLRKVAESEISKIVPGNYWNQKALKKLYISTQENIPKTIAILYRYGLLKALMSNCYGLGNMTSTILEDRNYLLFQMPPEEVSIEDFKIFKKYSNSLFANIEGMKHLMQKVNTVDRVISIFDPGVDSPNEAYLGERSKLVEIFLNAEKKSSWSVMELKKLRMLSNDVKTHIAIMQLAIDKSKTAKEFFETIHWGVGSPSDAFQNEILLLIKRSIYKFIALNPTVLEVNQMKRWCNDLDTIVILVKETLKRAQSASEFFELVKPVILFPNEKYLEQLRKIIYDSVDLFSSLNPTAEEMNRFKLSSGNLDSNIELIRWAIKKARSPSEFLSALSPGVANPSEGYASAITSIAHKYRNKFLDLDPSEEERRQFRETTGVHLPESGQHLSLRKRIIDCVSQLLR